MKSPYAPTYQWVCHSCKGANPPGQAVCGICGFPAKASAEDVAASLAKTEDVSRAVPWQSKSSIFRLDEIEHLASWKKVVAYVLWVIEFLCVMAAWLSFSLSVLVQSLIVGAVAEVAYQFLRRPFKNVVPQ